HDGCTLRGDACLEHLAEADRAVAAAAAEEDVVRGYLPLDVVGGLDGRAVEANARDVVLAAGVGAAAHVDAHLAGGRVLDAQLVQLLTDGAVEAHRAGDAELAGVRARAGDDVRDLL